MRQTCSRRSETKSRAGEQKVAVANVREHLSTPHILCDQVAGDIIDYGGAVSGRHYHLLTLDHQSMSIHDPRYDESGIHRVNPKYYGVAQGFVDRFIAVNSALIAQSNQRALMIDSMVNDSAASIQASLNVSEGDLASHFFSAVDLSFEVDRLLGRQMAEYAKAEFDSSPHKQKVARPAGPSFG